MKIRTKLSMQFACIVASILILFSISIYYSSVTYRKIEFKGRLFEKAQSVGKLLNTDEIINDDILKNIAKKTVPLYNADIIIFNDSNYQVLNTTDSLKFFNISNRLLDEIKLNKELYFDHQDKEFYGKYLSKNSTKHILIVSAEDIYGHSKIKNLLKILIIGFILSVLLTSFIAWIYAGLALRPISDVVSQVDNITINNLYSRVKEGNGKDEIAYLAVTFNKMLERLEGAFKMQRSFVSNASHELRTPLTSISGEIEVTLLKERKTDEYEKVLISILEEIKNLGKLSNGLLELAQASLDISSIKKQALRIDELIWQVRTDIIKHKKEYTINLDFGENLDDEKKLTIDGNEQLIKSAFFNLMDNGCKFSDNNQIDIKIAYHNKILKIDFKDQGMGISKEDLNYISEPFYRGYNAKVIDGHGIGLPLVYKIVKIHDCQILIDSEVNKGTTISLSFPVTN